MQGYIQVLSSGSKGNCYLLFDSRGKCLIIDLGISWKKGILPGLKYDLSNVVCSLVSHDHISDHTKSIIECMHNGIPVYGNNDVCEKYEKCNLIDKYLIIDGFTIQTFELVHNKPNNAFIIDTIDGIRVLYCTDTKYIPKIVRNVNVAMIECNYDDGVIIDNMMEGIDNNSQPEYHQCLNNCINYLKYIYSPSLQYILLIHLSNMNGDKEYFIKEVKFQIGFNEVDIASDNKIINLKKEDF